MLVGCLRKDVNMGKINSYGKAKKSLESMSQTLDFGGVIDYDEYERLYNSTEMQLPFDIYNLKSAKKQNEINKKTPMSPNIKDVSDKC